VKEADVLLLTKDKGTLDAAQSALQSGALRGSAGVCQDMVELKNYLAKPGAKQRSSVVVIDIDTDPDHVLYELGKIAFGNPQIRFIVLSREFSEKLVLQAMQAGARHFLRKSSIAAELDKVIEHLLVQETEPIMQLGDVISVFSCSGGSGATTVAVNVATELRLSSSKSVLLVDLDPHYGSVASYLGLKGNYGIAHILNREGQIDRHLVQSVGVSYMEGLDVLLSPVVAEADKAQSLNYRNLVKALTACRESHRYVVVDAPRLPAEAITDMASVSRVAIIVFQLTVRDVAYANSLIKSLTEGGMPREQVIPLANRVRHRGPMLKLEDSQRAIGSNSLVRIRSDWTKAMKSVNHGQPLAHIAKRSRLRRDFRKLAARIQRLTSNGD
jgi:pilus assembly protein CpaE